MATRWNTRRVLETAKVRHRSARERRVPRPVGMSVDLGLLMVRGFSTRRTTSDVMTTLPESAQLPMLAGVRTPAFLEASCESAMVVRFEE